MNQVEFSAKDILAHQDLLSQGPIGKRAIIAFEYILLRKDFKPLVKEIRDELEIPNDGYNPTDDFDKFKQYLTTEAYGNEVVFQKNISFGNDRSITDKIQNFIFNSGVMIELPKMFLNEGFILILLREYILFNRFVGVYKSFFGLVSIPEYKDFDDEEKSVEIRIELPISAKKEEIIDFLDSVKSSLDMVQEYLLDEKDFQRFKARKKLFRDLIIYNKYQKLKKISRKEKKRRNIKYYETEIQKAIETSNFGKLSNGTIRSIISKIDQKIEIVNS